MCAQTLSGPANGFSSQLQFSRPHVDPMEQLPNQLPQKLPIVRYTRQTEIEVLSGVIYIYINLGCQLNVIVLPSLKQTQR